MSILAEKTKEKENGNKRKCKKERKRNIGLISVFHVENWEGKINW